MFLRAASCCLAAGISMGCMFDQDLGKNSGQDLNGTGGGTSSGGSSASGGTSSGGSSASGGTSSGGSSASGGTSSGGTSSGGTGATGTGGSGGCPFEFPFLTPPTMLATGQLNAAALALDATSVYWVDGNFSNKGKGALMKVSKSGGQPETLASVAKYPALPDQAFDAAIGLVVSATHAYWRAAGGHQVWRVPIGGGTPQAVYQDGSGTGTADFLTGRGVYNIAVDAAHVYWTRYGSSTDQAVYVAPLAGGGAAPIPGSATSVSPSSVVTNGGGVYWATYGSYQMGFLDGSIRGADPGGTNAKVITSSFGNTEMLAADATSLYATGWELQRARKIELPSGVAVELNPAGTVRSIAVDDVNAYVTVDYAQNCLGLLRMPKAPGSTVPVPLRMSADFHPYTIAVDDQNVYWIDSTLWAISKMKK